MRKSWILLLFIVLFLSNCTTKKEEIIAFNDQIITEQEAVVLAEEKLVNAISSRELNVLDTLYNDLLNQIIRSENKLTTMIDPDPTIGFKQSANTLFSVYKTQTQEGYKLLIELSKIPDSLYTPQKMKQFEEVSSSVYVTIHAAVAKFITDQQKLAEKHHFSFQK